MSAISQWETVRRQVAIYGWVVDAENVPLANATVSIVSMPKTFARRISVEGRKTGKNKARIGLDQTLTREDGGFYFLDLPEGKYTLSVLSPISGLVGQQDAEIKRDKDRSINKVRLDIRVVNKVT